MSAMSSRRRNATLAFVALAAGTAALAAPVAASAAPQAHFTVTHRAHSTVAVDTAKDFIASINKAREAKGLKPVVESSRLTNLAEHHSDLMVNEQTLFHNLALPTIVKNWEIIGENVGEGTSESQVHTAFMHSAPHRANILGAGYTQVGVGVTEDSYGQLWVTEDFRKPFPGTYAAKKANREIAALLKAERKAS